MQVEQCDLPDCVCSFDMDTYLEQIGNSPDTDIIGWIEKDDISGPNLDNENVRIGDDIDPGVTIHVLCNNW